MAISKIIGSGLGTLSDGVTITTADNTTQLTLKSTDADASAGPRFDLTRDSASPADGDNIGRIRYLFDNDASEQTEGIRIDGVIQDASNGTEDVAYVFDTMIGGTLRERVGYRSAETVFNDDSQDIDFRIESNANTHAFFLNAGNDKIGIGTSTPARQLSIETTISAGGGTIGLTTSDSSTTGSLGIIHFGNNTDSSLASIGGLSDGSTSAGALLFKTEAAGGNIEERFRISSDGSLSTKTLGTDNVHFGENAGNSIASGGNRNVLIGKNAGTALTTGDSNVAIGWEALKTEDAHANSVAIGASALALQNAGADAYNVAIGYNAGAAVSTGIRNVIIGGEAGDALTDADHNTAVGYLALTADTKGSQSTAVGLSALAAQNFTTSTNANNTAVGAFAGDGITTGKFNTTIGCLANRATTTGDNNVMLGYNLENSTGVNGDHAIVIGVSVSGASNDFSFGKESNVVSNDFDADANWSRSSDQRLKKNIVNQSLGLDFINDLRTVKYKWKPNNELDASDAQLSHLRKDKEGRKEDHEDFDGTILNHMNTTVTMHNFIAQEVKTALDTAGVSSFGGWKEDDFGVQQVSREMFVIPLVKAVQELSTALDAALARIATLEGKSSVTLEG